MRRVAALFGRQSAEFGQKATPISRMRGAVIHRRPGIGGFSGFEHSLFIASTGSYRSTADGRDYQTLSLKVLRWRSGRTNE